MRRVCESFGIKFRIFSGNFKSRQRVYELQSIEYLNGTAEAEFIGCLHVSMDLRSFGNARSLYQHVVFLPVVRGQYWL